MEYLIAIALIAGGLVGTTFHLRSQSKKDDSKSYIGKERRWS